jgi:hypothetical protein
MPGGADGLPAGRLSLAFARHDFALNRRYGQFAARRRGGRACPTRIAPIVAGCRGARPDRLDNLEIA